MFNALAFYSPNVVNNGLIFNVDFADRTSYVSGSTILRDLSGNENNGTLTNGPIFTNSLGGRIIFDGVNDYINCGNNAILTSLSSVSVNVWFNIFSTGSGTFQGIIGKRSTLNPANYAINFNNSSFQWYYFNTTFRIASVSTSTHFSQNVWHNVSATFQQNGANTDARIYKNGVTIASTTLTGNLSSSTVPVLLGSSTTTEEYFSGSIGTAQIYNRALSIDEVQQNFNAQRSRFGI